MRALKALELGGELMSIVRSDPPTRVTVQKHAKPFIDEHNDPSLRETISAIPYRSFLKVEPLLFRGASVSLSKALSNGLHPRSMRLPGPKRAFFTDAAGNRQPRYHPQKYATGHDGELIYRGLGGHLNGKARGYTSLTQDLRIAREFSMGNPDFMGMNPKKGGVFVLKNVPSLNVNRIRQSELKAQRARGILSAIKAALLSAYKPQEHEFVAPDPISPDHIVGYRGTKSKSMGYDRNYARKAPIFLRLGLNQREKRYVIDCLTATQERRQGQRPSVQYFDASGYLYSTDEEVQIKTQHRLHRLKASRHAMRYSETSEGRNFPLRASA